MPHLPPKATIIEAVASPELDLIEGLAGRVRSDGLRSMYCLLFSLYFARILGRVLLE
jgi:hypothetical protein